MVLRSLCDDVPTRFGRACTEILADVRVPLYVMFALFLASKWLVLPAVASRVIFAIFIIVLVYETIHVLEKFLGSLL